jgi:AP2 domain
VTIEIPLSKGYVTRIDDADWALVGGRSWRAQANSRRRVVYAVIRIDGGKVVLMHSLLAPDWAEVDHADGDGLNNCRYNLRDGTGFRNSANRGLRSDSTTGYKGVWRSGRKWGASVGIDGKQIYLGTFGTPEEAAYAYDQAAVSHFGEYARTNAMMGLV